MAKETVEQQQDILDVQAKHLSKESETPIAIMRQGRGWVMRTGRGNRVMYHGAHSYRVMLCGLLLARRIILAQREEARDA